MGMTMFQHFKKLSGMSSYFVFKRSNPLSSLKTLKCNIQQLLHELLLFRPEDNGCYIPVFKERI